MAVIATEKDNELFLKIDNDDLTKMKEVLERWKFKNEQAFLRFAFGLLIATEDKALWIKFNREPIKVEPTDHSIKKKYVRWKKK